MDERTISRFWSRVDRGDSDRCWPWKNRRNAKGYGMFWAEGENMLAPRFALILKSGGTNHRKLQTRHLCHNPACCNPCHLEWGSGEQNVQDSVNAGRRSHLIGENHNRAILTEEQVVVIRSRHHTGASIRELALEYGVARCTIDAIVKRRNWKHVA